MGVGTAAMKATGAKFFTRFMQGFLFQSVEKAKIRTKQLGAKTNKTASTANSDKTANKMLLGWVGIGSGKATDAAKARRTAGRGWGCASWDGALPTDGAECITCASGGGGGDLWQRIWRGWGGGDPAGVGGGGLC